MARVKKDSKLYIPSKYVDLMTDYGFKLAFGDKELLMHFLNALFEKEGKVVKSVRYVNKEITSSHQQGRKIYYDVICKIDGEEDIIIEMQHNNQMTFGDRALYYMSNSIVKQGDSKSNWNYKLHPVYGVFIMNFHLEGKNVPEETVYEAGLLYKSNNKEFSDKFRMFFIDLLRFQKTEDELDSDLDCWIYNIKNMGTMTATPKKMATKKPFAKLYSRAEIAAMNPREYRQYEASLKLYRDALSVEETYRKKKAEAVEKGIAEGLEKGISKGRAESQIAIAQNLKAMNMPVEQIAQATGLTIEQINEL